MFELADNLTKLGHDVHMILPRIGNPESQTMAYVATIPFIDVPVLRPLSFHFFSSLYLFATIWRKTDLLYVRQMNSFLPSLIARITDRYTIYEIPNDPFIDYQTVPLIRRLFQQAMDCLSISLSDRVVVLSEWSKARLHQLGRVEESKIIVTPSGTDTELFRPLPKDECCRKLNLDSSFFYVGFIGTFAPYQGVDTLISVAPNILKQHQKTKFLLVGDGQMRKEWMDMIKENGLEEAFILTGHIPYKEMPAYIGAMDVCVAPHKGDSNQASPVKLFDYMACGKPIVASDLAVVREITAQADCALLCPASNPGQLAKAIITLAMDSKMRTVLGQHGRTYAIANYDRQQISTNFLQAMKIH